MLCIGGWIRGLGSRKNELGALYLVLCALNVANDSCPDKKRTKVKALSTKSTLPK